ncbi:MAG TPA: 50S ribosomal protein L25 [Candidatus Acidoferrum sp.]|nr:50S ribosomal protein L25 [Candidatus Acidoferrum sp.]
MSDKIGLVLEDRQAEGKAVKALRAQGFVPGVIYGHDMTPLNVMAPEVPMTKVYRTAGRHHPVELELGAAKHLAMIKAVDMDPVKRTLRHVSFQAIKQNEKVETEVPIVIAGEGNTPAERAGFVVLTTIETVEVSALPAALPDNIEAPGEKLAEVGDRLTIADLIVPAGVTILSDPEQMIASVYEPSALAAENDKLAGEAEEVAEVAAESGEAGAAAEGEEPAEGENQSKKEEK